MRPKTRGNLLTKPLLWLSAFVLIAVDSSIAATTEFDYSAYKPATIAELLTIHKDDECRKTARNEYVLSSYAFKYRIVTNFTRQLKELSPDVKELIRRWGKSFPWNQEVSEMYKHEFLVKDGSKEYWVPVQEQLLPFMGDELKAGQRFELYVAVIGAVNNKCVFVATEFRALPQ